MLEPLGTLIASITLRIRRQPRPEFPKCFRLWSGSQSFVVFEYFQSDIREFIPDLITGQIAPWAILEGINLVKYLLSAWFRLQRTNSSEVCPEEVWVLLSEDDDCFCMVCGEVMAILSASGVRSLQVRSLQRLSVGSNYDTELLLVFPTLLNERYDICGERLGLLG